MGSAEAQLAFLFAVLLLVGIGLVAMLRSERRPGPGILMATWLVVTALLFWFVALASFLAVNVLLFAFGTVAAGVGFVVAAICLVATPFAAGLVVRHYGHHLSPHS